MGEDAYIDAHIIVNSRISVSEGHVIGDAVRDNLIARFDDVVDVLVHIDPEDDEYIHKTNPLSRLEIQAFLELYLAGLNEQIEDFNLHYLDNHIEIELILAYKSLNPELLVELKQRCVQMQTNVTSITQIFLFFKAEITATFNDASEYPDKPLQ
jgi:hypothetical protein